MSARPSNQMTISPSLNRAQTQPVMVAKTTASACPGSWRRNWAIGVRKTNTSAITVTASIIVHSVPTPSVKLGRVEASSGASLSSSSSTESSSSSETPKVRIIVPGFESRWMSCVTRPVRKKSSA